MTLRSLIIFLFLIACSAETQTLNSEACHKYYTKSSLINTDNKNTLELINRFEFLSNLVNKNLKTLNTVSDKNSLLLNRNLTYEINSLLNETYLLKEHINNFLETNSTDSTLDSQETIAKLKIIKKIDIPEIIQKLIQLQIKFPELDFTTLTTHTQSIKATQSSSFLRKFELQPQTSHGKLLLTSLQFEGINLNKRTLQEILLEKDAFGNETEFVKKISFSDFKLILSEVFNKKIDLEKIITGSESTNNVLEVDRKEYQYNVIALHFETPRKNHIHNSIIYVDNTLYGLSEINRDLKNLLFLINITDFNLLDPNNKEIFLMTSYFEELLNEKFKGFFGLQLRKSTKTSKQVYMEVLQALNMFIANSESGLSIYKRAYIESLRNSSSPLFLDVSIGKVKFFGHSHLINKKRDLYEN